MDLTRLGSFADFSLREIDFNQALGIGLGAALVLPLLLGSWAYFTDRKMGRTRSRNWLARLALPVFWALVLVLAATSFGAILIQGHMFGYTLLAHLSAAGAFVFVLLIVTPLSLFHGSSGSRGMGANRWWLVRWSAWTMILSSVLTAATMFVSMLPILGTNELLEAIALHRFAGLLVVIASLVHVAALCCTRVGLR